MGKIPLTLTALPTEAQYSWGSFLPHLSLYVKHHPDEGHSENQQFDPTIIPSFIHLLFKAAAHIHTLQTLPLFLFTYHLSDGL